MIWTILTLLAIACLVVLAVIIYRGSRGNDPPDRKIMDKYISSKKNITDWGCPRKQERTIYPKK